MGSQKNHSRRKKRKFYGNQSVRPKKLKVNTERNNSCLRRLMKLQKSFEDEKYQMKNRMITKLLLILERFLSSQIYLSGGMGYAHKIYIACRDCSYQESTYASKKSQKVSKSQGRRKFDANIKTVAAFREI